MANKGPRILVRMNSTGKNEKNKPTGTFYTTEKNSRNTTDKLKLKKFDRRAVLKDDNGNVIKRGIMVDFKEGKIK